MPSKTQFESGSLSKGREYLLTTNSFTRYIDVQFFSTFRLPCSCSSHWLYNEGKMECTFYLSPLPCFPFCSVVDIWPAAHLPHISQIPTHVTDTGRLHLMVLVCLNRSHLSVLDHAQWCCNSGRRLWVRVARKKDLFDMCVWGERVLCSSFFFFSQKDCFIVGFRYNLNVFWL